MFVVVAEVALVDMRVGDDLVAEAFLPALADEAGLPPAEVEPPISVVPDDALRLADSEQHAVLVLGYLVLRGLEPLVVVVLGV